MITETTASECSIAEQIHAVAQGAYKLEAELIGCADFPPLRESINDLKQSSDSFLVFQLSGSIVGALSFDHTAENLVTITRLVVAPSHVREGVATALLGQLERRLPLGVGLNVSTAAANTPAVLLYQRLGYAISSVSTAPEGISLIHLSKSNQRSTYTDRVG